MTRLTAFLCAFTTRGLLRPARLNAIFKAKDAAVASGGLLSLSDGATFEEEVKDAANRRLMEEMGMKAELLSAFSFQYKSHLDHNLIEHELDHVFIGFSNDIPIPNKDEVEGYCYMSPEDIQLGFEKHPNEYTTWLQICFKELMNYINKNKNYEKVS